MLKWNKNGINRFADTVCIILYVWPKVVFFYTRKLCLRSLQKIFYYLWLKWTMKFLDRILLISNSYRIPKSIAPKVYKIVLDRPLVTGKSSVSVPEKLMNIGQWDLSMLSGTHTPTRATIHIIYAEHVYTILFLHRLFVFSPILSNSISIRIFLLFYSLLKIILIFTAAFLLCTQHLFTIALERLFNNIKITKTQNNSWKLYKQNTQFTFIYTHTHTHTESNVVFWKHKHLVFLCVFMCDNYAKKMDLTQAERTDKKWKKKKRNRWGAHRCVCIKLFAKKMDGGE